MVLEGLPDAARERLLGLKHVVVLQLLGPRPLLVGWTSAQLEDEVHLLHLVLARQDGLPHKQLRKDAPHRPHVDLRPVLVRPKEQLGRPIPQGNNTVCECVGVLLGPGTCEPKVGQLQHALVVYQKVRPLDVAVQHVVGMAVVQAGQQLQHVALDLRRGELHPRSICQTREVMVHILKHHIDAPFIVVALVRFRCHYLLQPDHVLVVQRLEDFYLADRRNGKALPLVIHSYLLKGNNLARGLLFGHVHLAVRALSDLLNVLEVLYTPRAQRKVLVRVHAPRRSGPERGRRHPL
mmetsp:Transcript_1310/g.2275  ORF Transcript_1310/g.2275 Transcript_1310/m.2275 type:complete len:293 (-) Transcript_1310:268-1146(-)